MAVLKWKNVGEWVTLYASSIKNKLRKDLNLSDLTDRVEALKNLSLVGDISFVSDPASPADKHSHDRRYSNMINEAVTDCLNKVSSFTVKLSGDAFSGKTSVVNGTYDVAVSDIIASRNRVRNATGKGYIMVASGSGEQYLNISSGCYADAQGTISCTNMSASNKITGTTITGTKVYGAVWNDYAEYFPRGGEVEPGDIVQLDLNSKEEKYVKLGYDRRGIVGVCSNEYSHIIGGELPPEGKDFKEWNDKNYIAVALAGRVHVNVIGPATKGDCLVPDVEGCARVYVQGVDDPAMIIGMLVECDDKIEKRKLKMKIK